jgi:hypothetical protein
MEPDFHKNPCCVITSYLDVCHLYISDEGDDVSLIGCYGNIINGSFVPVLVETDFKTFYELLSEINPSDNLLAAIEKRVAAPSEKNELIEMVDDVLCFTDHIFSLGIICEEDDFGNLTHSEENAYLLQAYIKRQELLSDFPSFNLPKGKMELSRYYNRLFAIKYHFYLHIQKTNGPEIALQFTHLTDPLAFSTAKAQYNLQRGANKRW